MPLPLTISLFYPSNGTGHMAQRIEVDGFDAIAAAKRHGLSMIHHPNGESAIWWPVEKIWTSDADGKTRIDDIETWLGSSQGGPAHV